MRNILIALLAATSCIAGATVTAVRVEESPVMDGRLDDAAWENSSPLAADFVLHRPACGDPMSEETVIRAVYDDEKLYFGLCMRDPSPESFLRIVAPRDSDFAGAGEWVGVWLDTYNDNSNAYYFMVSVDNVQQDGRLSEVGGWDPNWDAVWESATAVTDSGWTAEMAIPFSVLRYSSEEEQTWGINFKRSITRTNESGFLFRMADNGSVRIRDFGELRGLRSLPSKRLIELRPYGAGRLQYGQPTEEGWVPWGSAGLDARVGLSTDLSLDLAVNPDFGQVEADPDQVNLSHWETYLPERRPFFQEGSDLFSMPFSIFYSRRIGSIAPGGEIIPILGGAKLTGMAGGFRTGMMSAMTGAVREGDSLTVRPANYSAGRLLREFGNGSYAGISYTGKELFGFEGNEHSYGRAGAVDTKLSLTERHSVRGSIAGTWNSDAEWRDNLAYSANYTFDSGRFNAGGGFSRKEDGFDPGMTGYASSTGAVETFLKARLYRPFSNGGAFQQMWLSTNVSYSRVPGGPVTSRGARFGGGALFTNRYHIGLSMEYTGPYTDRYEGPEGTEYDGGIGLSLDSSTDYRKPLHGSVWGGFGPWCEGLRRWAGAWVRWRLTPGFSVEGSLDWSTTSDARKYDWQAGEWDFRDTDWRSLRGGFQVMPASRLSLRLASQVSRFEYSWYSGQRRREYSHWMNLLLSWEFQPGSMLYLMVGENSDPDTDTGDAADPGFTLYTKLTWFLPALL